MPPSGGSRTRRGPRDLSVEEERLWRHAMRDIRPLRPEPAADTEVRTTTTHRSRPGAGQAVRHAPHERSQEQRRPMALERRQWQKLKRGRLAIDARLDLHGLTQAEAHARLDGFITAQQARGSRCVLVITGLGNAQGGILRRMTPRWLDAPPNQERVLAYGTAHLRDGGDGALYVMLRRRRG